MSNLVEFRASAVKAMAKYEEIWNSRFNENGERRQMTNEEFKEIFSILPGYKLNDGVFYSVRHIITGWTPETLAEPSENIAELVEYLKNNRIKATVWFATMKAAADKIGLIYNVNVRNGNIIFSQDETSMIAGSELLEDINFYYMLKQLSVIEITRENLIRGISTYNDWLASYSRQLRNNSIPEAKNTGIEKVFEQAPKPEAELILAQLDEAIKLLPSNGLTARTWGFEIEVPDAKNVTPRFNSGIEKGEDGSLRSYEGNDECECGCSDCVFHSCDCDNCTDYNDDPSHCGDSDCQTADMAEFRTVGGVQRAHHNGMYQLCKELNENNAEMNDTAGTHIHVYAQDLTTHQVGQVMAIYKYIEGIVSPIAGRYNVNYAGKVRTDHVAAALKRKDPKLNNVKQVAVNVMHLLGGRGTIEFRQMDCNLNANKITFWAWLVRGLVETAKRGASLKDFKKVQDLNDVIDVLGKFEFFIQNENPGDVIFGSKSDQMLVKTQMHKRID
jgi:hypothetical protein